MFTFHNPSKFPGYLHTNLIEVWGINFYKCINHIGISQPLPENINIEFSDEEKTREYGMLSLDDIIQLIKEKWEIDGKIQEVLENIKTYSDYNQCYEPLAAMIHNLNKNTNYDDIHKQLDRLFNNLYFSLPVLGEYIPGKKTIIFYTKNIEKHNIPGRTNTRAFEAVFAHEYFHAFHYGNNSDELFCRSDYTSKIVKESLASAFEWFYCSENSIAGTENLEESWEHSIWSYPYSGAKLLVRYGFNSGKRLNIDLFKEIYQISIRDMDNALRKLLPVREFYEVKNLVTIRRDKIDKKIVSSSQKAHAFKVSQRMHFTDEKDGGYIFAPAMAKHKAINSIKKGDIIFHIFNGLLYAISMATGDRYYSSDAHERHEAGWYVDLTYFVFPTPINIRKFKSEPCYPIGRNEPYIKTFDNSDFIRLILNEAKILYPDNLCILLIEELLLPEITVITNSKTTAKVGTSPELSKDIYLEWSKGNTGVWTIVTEHPVKITIKNRACTIIYEAKNIVTKTVTKNLSDKNYSALLSIFKRYKDILISDSNWISVYFDENHTKVFDRGAPDSYIYEFEGKTNYPGSVRLFDDTDKIRFEEATKAYEKVIDDIINQN